jgi:outer membrane usher protein
MRSLTRWPGGRSCAIVVCAALLGIVLGAGRSRASDEPKNLQLDVVINSVPAGMIGAFIRFDDGRIGGTIEELESLGLRPRQRRRPDEIIALDDIPTLQYQYDERGQRILITVEDIGRKPRSYDARGDANRGVVRAQAGYGAVLNYDLLTSTSNFRTLGSLSLARSSLSLNARLFSPYGTAEQSAILRGGPQQPAEVMRLNSSYRYSDEERMVSYVAGDTINGGLPWSRPIRIGGLQAQRNFALRPDLITAPLATLGGSAAVPSTVDVYVNNIKTFSQDVGTGPFSVNNVPLISGAGKTELVIRDSAGHETRSTTPFYAAPNLLASGLTSWSVEAGFPRLSYGSTSDVYVGSPIGSATLRRGIYDGLTAEAHGEAGAGVVNGGVGAVVKTGTIGVAAVALSGSSSGGAHGLQTYASYETQLFGLSFSASSQRTFGTYDDLASATARLQAIVAGSPLNFNGLFGYLPTTSLPSSTSLAYVAGIYGNARAPIALDRITFSAPMPFDPKASLSASFVHLVDASRHVSDIVTASYSRPMPYNASLFATVFHDFGNNKNTGIFGGLSLPLGDSASMSTGVSRGQGGTTASVDAVKSLGPEPGSYGWRVRDAEGSSSYREATAAYRSSYGTVQVGASQVRSSGVGALELRGSITTMGGGVFLSNWIDDSFAVVKTGAPGVEVLNENRRAGVTGSNGMLLIPMLRSYQKNKIAIDPTNLPVDSEAPTTHDIVAPADRAGVLVSFEVRKETTAALVTFVRPDNSFVPAGAVGHIAGGEEFIVGYDGQAYIKGLSGTNQADIEFIGGKCHAGFAFAPIAGQQVQISRVECR